MFGWSERQDDEGYNIERGSGVIVVVRTLRPSRLARASRAPTTSVDRSSDGEPSESPAVCCWDLGLVVRGDDHSFFNSVVRMAGSVGRGRPQPVPLLPPIKSGGACRLVSAWGDLASLLFDGSGFGEGGHHDIRFQAMGVVGPQVG